MASRIMRGMAVLEAHRSAPVLGELLGEGGSARVHAARWAGNDVCAKIAHAASDTSLLAEAAASARVTHPALAPVLDAGRLPDGRPYLVVPRVAGEDLASRLARGPLAIAEALAIARAIGGALGALHAAGLLHRDVKPENVMLGPAGPVLIDLGLACEQERSTISVRIRGTLDHVAPERLFGEPATIASEVYELAALVWIMLAGHLPWPSGAGPAARRGIGALAVPGAEALDVVLHRALSTIPERRPPSVAALVAELDAAASGGIVRDRQTCDVAADITARDTPARGPAVAIGGIIGETYRLLEVLGAGGSGKVFAAEHLRLPRRFAIKVLQADRDDADAHARFRREAEVIAAVAHPRIVEVFDHDVDDTGVPFMVMRLLAGETLRERLRRGPLAPADVVALVAQTASAIDAAHAAGVVHRDLKPSNVFLAPTDAIDVTVLDFGVSKLLDQRERTIEGTLLGTPGYAAPEQVTGGTIGPAADVFALAAIAYEALTGRRAFDAPTRDATLYRICHAEPTPIAEASAIDRVLRMGLAKDPARRIASASAFAAALANAVASPPRRRRTLVIGIAAAALAALAIAWVAAASTSSAAPASASAAVPATGAAAASVPATGAVAVPATSAAPASAAVPATGAASIWGPATGAASVPATGAAPAVAVTVATTRARTRPPTSAHTVRLVLEPRTARATLDGKPVGATVYLPDGKHRLVVSAAGRTSIVRTLDGAAVGDELRVVLPRPPRPTSLRSLLEH